MRQVHQLLLTALLSLTFVVTKAQKKEPPVLLLKEGAVKPAFNITEAAIEAFNNKAARHKERAFAVLQFESIPSAETRNALSTERLYGKYLWKAECRCIKKGRCQSSDTTYCEAKDAPCTG
jgi:hypothetical protein